MSLVSSLMEMRNMIDLMLESSGSSAGKNGLKLTKSGKPKKISDRKGKPNANGDWLKRMKVEHGAEMKAFHDASEDKRGTTMKFAKQWRQDHEDEYKQFLSDWKETHSDSSAASVAESDTMDADIEPAVTTAPVATVTTVAPVAPVQKKQVKKAQKAITTAIAEPIQSVIVEEFLPFTMGALTYLRKGYQRPDGNHLWTTGHLWISKKGAKGPYAGQIQPDGSIDTDTDEPTA